MKNPRAIATLLLALAPCAAFVPALVGRGGRVHGCVHSIDVRETWTKHRKKSCSTCSLSMTGIDEYRGSNNWEGLIPSVTSPREWDEGFQSFLIKYGMLNEIVYDVFIKGDEDETDDQGLRGTSRFNDDLEAFTKDGLRFNYVNKQGEEKKEYDFSSDYTVTDNIICSPRSFETAEDNWFGYVAISSDTKELLIVFRGTETKKEWIEDGTGKLTPLEGEPEWDVTDPTLNRKNLMCHTGFQQLYDQESTQGLESPWETVNRVVEEHKGTIDKVTVLGHSLGAAMAQLCAIHLVRDELLGDIPILAMAWASPKIGNQCLADWVMEQDNLRILRPRVDDDPVPKVPPEWFQKVLTGGYFHTGTELLLDNQDLQDAGLINIEPTGGFQHHNLEQYMYNMDQSRDPALMDKIGDGIPDEYCSEHDISPLWHTQTWPRTLYD